MYHARGIEMHDGFDDVSLADLDDDTAGASVHIKVATTGDVTLRYIMTSFVIILFVISLRCSLGLTSFRRHLENVLFDGFPMQPRTNVHVVHGKRPCRKIRNHAKVI